MIAKICPQCNLENDVESLGCECGYCFVDDVIAAQTADSLQVLRVRRKNIFKKGLSILAVLGLLVVGITYLSGLLRASNGAAFGDEPLPPQKTEPESANTTGSEEPSLPSDDKPYRVVKVSTGDAIDIVDANGQEHRITLFGIKAPKLNEQFAAESRQNLSNLVLGRIVMIKTKKAATDGTVSAEVLSGNRNVGLAQIEAGLVTVISDDLVDQTEFARREYLGAELGAKSSRFGIWSGSKGISVTTADSEYASTTVPEAYSVYSRPEGITPVGGQPGGPLKQAFPDRTNAREPVQEPKRVADVPVSTSPPLAPPKVTLPEPKVVEQPRPPVIQSSNQTDSSAIKYIRGPRGGCYFLSASGSKKYVDRSICN